MATHAGDVYRVRENASYARRMSTHIAYALVLYTLLLIFAVSPQMESKGMSIMPYLTLVLLVAAVIIPCRNLERRWQTIDSNGDASARSNPGQQFTREVVGLWLCAIGLPLLLMAVLWIIP